MTRDFASKSNKNRKAQNNKSQKKKPSKTKMSKNNRRQKAAVEKNTIPGWAWLLLGLGLGITSVLIGLFFVPSEQDAHALTEDELTFEHQNDASTKAPQGTLSISNTSATDQQDANMQSPTVAKITSNESQKKESTGPEFAFFTLLPEQEVMVQNMHRPKKSHKQQSVHQHRPSINGKFILQVGSFQQEEDAKRHQKKLHKRGLPSNIQQGVVTRDNVETIWYRVFVGPYSTSEQIEYAENKLADLGISPLLIKRN